MNSAHLHLALNHLPVLGLFFSLAILVAGRLCRNDATLRVGLWLLLATALTALPAFLTGEPAEDVIERFPGIEKPMIEQHEDAAGLALGSALAAGLAAALVLFLSRKRSVPTWGLIAAVLVSTLSAASMVWTARIGGQIRHSEIRAGVPQMESTTALSHED